MNPKRQKILMLILLVVLAGVVARRQFFKTDGYEGRDAERTERAETRDSRQRERDQKRETADQQRKSDREADQSDRETASQQRRTDGEADQADREAASRQRRTDREASRTDRHAGTAGFDRTINNIIYSKHARCRMDCRRIDESEILEIRDKGEVNLAKSELDSKRDPKYALEGVTHDRQHVRIVFAQTTNSLVVVTCIDLDTDWSCRCN